MWYVVQVSPGQENTSLQMCEKQVKAEEYHSMFVPRYMIRKKYRGEWRDVCKILFPGYFFIDTDSVDQVAKSLSAVPKLTKLLSSAGSISPITEEEKRYLEEMMDEEYVVHVSTGFFIGERICITEGALRNKAGWIKKIDRHRRTAQLEVEFFGRMTPVEVGLEVLCKVTEEEFREMKSQAAKECESAMEIGQSISSGTMVTVVSGIFESMTGPVVSVNEIKNEWKVRLQLFGSPADVVFRGEELAIQSG